MSQPEQTAKSQPHKALPPQRIPDKIQNNDTTVADISSSPMETQSMAASGMLEQFPAAQQQAMVGQLGQMHGNAYVQQLLGQRDQPATTPLAAPTPVSLNLAPNLPVRSEPETAMPDSRASEVDSEQDPFLKAPAVVKPGEASAPAGDENVNEKAAAVSPVKTKERPSDAIPDKLVEETVASKELSVSADESSEVGKPEEGSSDSAAANAKPEEAANGEPPPAEDEALEAAEEGAAVDMKDAGGADDEAEKEGVAQKDGVETEGGAAGSEFESPRFSSMADVRSALEKMAQGAGGFFGNAVPAGGDVLSQVPSVGAWGSNVGQAIQGIRTPDLAPIVSSPQRLQSLSSTMLAGRLGVKSPADLQGDVRGSVGAPPSVKEPPPAPEVNPVPEALALISAAANKSVPQQRMPALVASPRNQLPNVGGGVVVSNDQPQEIAPPTGGEAQSLNPKFKDMQDDMAAASALTADAGTPPGLALPDVPPAPQVEALSPEFKTRFAERLQGVLDNAPEHAKSVVGHALGKAYPQGVLKRVAPEGFASDLEDPEKTVICDTAGGLQTLVSTAQDSLEENVDALETGVKDAQATAAQGLRDGQARANQNLHQAGSDKQANIAGAGAAMREEIAKKTEAADTELDPTAIHKKHTDLISKITTDTAAADANYRRIEQVRHQQLDSAGARYQGAYRSKSRQEAATVRGEHPDDEAAGRVEARRSLDWGDAQVGAVQTTVTQLKQELSRVVQQHRDALKQAAATAKEKVTKWAEAELDKQDAWSCEIGLQMRGWESQATANEKAWEELQKRVQLQDMARDYQAMQAYKQAEEEGNQEAMQQALRYLSQEHRSLIQSHITPLDILANDILEKIKKQRAPELIDKLKEKALAELDMQQLNDIGAAQNPGFDARKASRDVYTAIASWTGTDKKKLFAALENRTPEQIAAIRKAYSQYHGGRTMETDIKNEHAITGAALDRVDAALSGDETDQAVAGLRNAMKGGGGFSSIGSDKESIRNALRGKTPEELEEIKAAYQEKYHESLESSLESELGNWFTKDYELDRANALLAGDTAKADAIGIEQAMEDTWFSPDTQAIEKIYDQNRQEVEATADKKNMSTAELEAAIRARNAGIESAYNQNNAGEAGLRDALTDSYDNSWFKTGASAHADKDLVGGLMDYDPTAIDAAHMQSAASSAAWYRNASMVAGGVVAGPGGAALMANVGGHLFNQDKAMTDALKAQHERAQKNVLRDEKVKFMEHIPEEQRASPAAAALWAKYQKENKDKLEAKVEAAANGNMDALQDTFGENYGEYWEGEKNWTSWVDPARGLENMGEQSALETAVGFGTSFISNRGEMGQTLIEQNGKLSDAQELAFAMHGSAKQGAEKPNWVLSQIRGWGTDEDAIKNTFNGKSAEEIEEIKNEYAKLTGRELKNDLQWELDGRDRFDVLEDKFLGEPQTLEEKLARAQKRREFEERQLEPSLLGYAVPGIWALQSMSYQLSSVERERLDVTIAEAEAKLQAYEEAEAAGDEAQMAKLKQEFDQVYGCVDYDVNAYRKAVDAIADNTATAVGVTVAVAGSVLATVLSAGSAGPGVAALWAAGIAAAGGTASLAAKVSIKGLEAHGYETLAGDLGLLAIDVALSAATAGLIESSSLAKSLLDGDEFIKFITKGQLDEVANLPVAQRLFARAIGNATTSALGGLPSAVIGTVADENTWKGDMPIYALLNSIATKTVTSAGTSAVVGTGAAELNAWVKKLKWVQEKRPGWEKYWSELEADIQNSWSRNLRDNQGQAHVEGVDLEAEVPLELKPEVIQDGDVNTTPDVEGDVDTPNSGKNDPEGDLPDVDPSNNANHDTTGDVPDADIDPVGGKAKDELLTEIDELLYQNTLSEEQYLQLQEKLNDPVLDSASPEEFGALLDAVCGANFENIDGQWVRHGDSHGGQSAPSANGADVITDPSRLLPAPSATNQKIAAKYDADLAQDVFRTMGQVKNADIPKEILAQRTQTAYDFYLESGFGPTYIASHVGGIDYSQPVEVITLKKGMVVEQWQVPSASQGSYYAPVGTPMSELGISETSLDKGSGHIVRRELNQYVVLTDDVQVLRSTAGPVVDDWSIPAQDTPTEGGGIQYFTTDKDAFKHVTTEED